jgi:hypothetical protein
MFSIVVVDDILPHAAVAALKISRLDLILFTRELSITG